METQLNYHYTGRNCRTIWVVWNNLIISKEVILHRVHNLHNYHNVHDNTVTVQQVIAS